MLLWRDLRCHIDRVSASQVSKSTTKGMWNGYSTGLDSMYCLCIVQERLCSSNSWNRPSSPPAPCDVPDLSRRTTPGSMRHETWSSGRPPTPMRQDGPCFSFNPSLCGFMGPGSRREDRVRFSAARLKYPQQGNRHQWTF